jgi:hypothetical protein
LLSFFLPNEEMKMTRIKEPPAGTIGAPIEYKSPPSRIIRSLRKAYDNVRKKVKEKSEQIQNLRGKLRDTQESREDWKILAKKAEEKTLELEEKNKELQEELKKRLESHRQRA